MQVWNVLHAAHWKCRTQKIAKKSPSAHHRTTLSDYIFRKVSRSRFCADRAQNQSGPAPNNILGVPQISSKSVHFRRSYTERVNIVETRHKVFPILGEASSPSKYIEHRVVSTSTSRPTNIEKLPIYWLPDTVRHNDSSLRNVVPKKLSIVFVLSLSGKRWLKTVQQSCPSVRICSCARSYSLAIQYCYTKHLLHYRPCEVVNYIREQVALLHY